jgi:hypothetical protein
LIFGAFYATGSFTPRTMTDTTTEAPAAVGTTTETLTTTVYTAATSTSIACTNTEGIGCPRFFNQTYAISVSYAGPWGVSYQGYLGVGESGRLVASGSFYGNAPADRSVTVSGTDAYGITLCTEAQKLDASNSTLVLRILPPADVMNQTSLAYGTTKACLADVVA